MLRRWTFTVIASIALFAGIPVVGSEPASAATTRSLSIFVDTDYTIYVDETAFAGLTRVTLENRADDSFGVSLYRVPADVLARVAAEGGTPEALPSGLPRWLEDATPIGGPGITGMGTETEALVDLQVGSYVLVFTFFPLQEGQLPALLLSSEDGQPFVIEVTADPTPTETPAPTSTEPSPPGGTGGDGEPTSQALMPTPTSDDSPSEGGDDGDDSSGDPEELPDSPSEIASVTVVMTDSGFQAPERFTAGPQNWEVVNQGQVTHALIIVAIPAGTTADQVLATLFPGPDRTATSFDTSAMVNVGGLGPLAPGLSAATTLDLAAGTYAMFSAIPDPVTGEPDGARGLLSVFSVE